MVNYLVVNQNQQNHLNGKSNWQIKLEGQKNKKMSESNSSW